MTWAARRLMTDWGPPKAEPFSSSVPVITDWSCTHILGFNRCPHHPLTFHHRGIFIKFWNSLGTWLPLQALPWFLVPLHVHFMTSEEIISEVTKSHPDTSHWVLWRAWLLSALPPSAHGLGVLGPGMDGRGGFQICPPDRRLTADTYFQPQTWYLCVEHSMTNFHVFHFIIRKTCALFNND